MSIRWIDTARVSDGNGNLVSVKIGDFVDLLPPDPNNSKGLKDIYLSQENYYFTLDFLYNKKGPYKINRIGAWPCGGINLYLDFPYGREPGAGSYNFMKVDGPK